jgi:putative serine protease PepD
MTTTPDEPRPDEAAEPIVDRAAEQPATSGEAIAPDEAPAPAAGDTQPIPGTPTPGDTQPVRLNDTAPLPAAPATPPAPPAPAAPSYPAAGYQPPYSGQPYAGPAYPAPPAYPAQPGYPPQPMYPPPQQHGYGPRPIGAERGYGSPYAPPQHPYAAQHPYAGAPLAPGGAVPPPPGTPAADGTLPAPGPHKRRTWLPVVATLVVVVLLAVAAIITATHHWRGTSTASQAGPQSTSIASIGQGGAGTVPVAGSTAANPNWTAVAAAVQGAVVAIDVQTSSGEALGSGVLVDNKGHVVTNNHVVDGLQGRTVQVTLSDGRLYDATITGTDASTDLAVVTLKNPPSDLTVAQFGNSDDVRVGDPVMAVGNPLGLANTVTTGIVSAVNRPVSPQTDAGTQGPVTNALQIDAAVNPGNSGGPLFNAQGQVIGITSSIATTSSSSGSIGLGFAIPVKLVSNIAQQIIANGSAKHAYLGVTLQDGQATADGVTRRGAQVMSVTASSPASAAGLQAGDVVVAINGQPVGSSDSLAAFVRAMSTGDKANLVLVRNGKSLTVTVTLATKADTSTGTPTQNPQGAPSNQNGNSGNGNSLQGKTQNMTPQQLWQWLQQQQGQSTTPGGSAQG